MSRLNWQQRHGPDEFDDTAPHEPSLEFDCKHSGGAAPWPAQIGKVKFGPSLIKQAWQAGLVVIAYIEGFPNPVAVTESRWNAAKCFEVRSQGIWYLPKRIRTVKMSSALKSTGEWVE